MSDTAPPLPPPRPDPTYLWPVCAGLAAAGVLGLLVLTAIAFSQAPWNPRVFYVLMVPLCATPIGAFFGFMSASVRGEAARMRELSTGAKAFLGGAVVVDAAKGPQSTLWQLAANIAATCGLPGDGALVLLIAVAAGTLGFMLMYLYKMLLLSRDLADVAGDDEVQRRFLAAPLEQGGGGAGDGSRGRGDDGGPPGGPPDEPPDGPGGSDGGAPASGDAPDGGLGNRGGPAHGGRGGPGGVPGGSATPSRQGPSKTILIGTLREAPKTRRFVWEGLGPMGPVISITGKTGPRPARGPMGTTEPLTGGQGVSGSVGGAGVSSTGTPREEPTIQVPLESVEGVGEVVIGGVAVPEAEGGADPAAEPEKGSVADATEQTPPPQTTFKESPSEDMPSAPSPRPIKAASPQPPRARNNDDDDDPQKGQWGGRSAADGYRLRARVDPVETGWFLVRLEIVPERPDIRLPKGAYAVFHLHPTFSVPKTREYAKGGAIKLDLRAWGAFTVGAEVFVGRQRITALELDLAQLKSAPAEFREN